MKMIFQISLEIYFCHQDVSKINDNYIMDMIKEKIAAADDESVNRLDIVRNPMNCWIRSAKRRM